MMSQSCIVAYDVITSLSLVTQLELIHSGVRQFGHVRAMLQLLCHNWLLNSILIHLRIHLVWLKQGSLFQQRKS